MIYDADGNRLVRDDGDTVSVFLPGTEAVWNTTTNDVDVTRYFDHAGQIVAICTGPDVADWTWMGVDHHGTTTTHSVNAFTGVSHTRRLDPYGNQRGPAPQFWPGQRHFVGGIHDPTGLSPCTPDGYNVCPGQDIRTQTTPPPARPLGPPSPPTCSRATPEYCHSPGTNTMGPYTLGAVWVATGILGVACAIATRHPCAQNWGPGSPAQVVYFRDGDPFTEGIRRHQHLVDARLYIANQLAQGRSYGDYHMWYGSDDFSREDRKRIFFDNIRSVLSNGQVGMPIEQGFLGSYDLVGQPHLV